ncbi:hypothetical protein ACH5RR_008484 [Cinchona calisaya]|uniref:Uncharacterized protein n=1 Tax=Cinchona calisaya TaxID=153742 RepID=A0ABD3AEF2_9GENT
MAHSSSLIVATDRTVEGSTTFMMIQLMTISQFRRAKKSFIEKDASYSLSFSDLVDGFDYLQPMVMGILHDFLESLDAKLVNISEKLVQDDPSMHIKIGIQSLGSSMSAFAWKLKHHKSTLGDWNKNVFGNILDSVKWAEDKVPIFVY